MFKRVFAALALAVSYLATSSGAHAQDLVPCQAFSDPIAGFQCGLGARAGQDVSNWLVIGGANPSFAGDNSVAVGSNAWAIGDNAVTLGSNTNAFNLNSTAIGFGADVFGNNSTALGANSSVSNGVSNAVALGQGSVANQSNTVSVGVFGGERRIVNVAAPIDATDAANRQYVDNQLITAHDFASFAADQARIQAQQFATGEANNARTQAQNFATNLVTGGSVNANFAAVGANNANFASVGANNANFNTLNVTGAINANGGGINNAGRIRGVSNGIAPDDAANVSQLNAVATNAQAAANTAQTNAQNFATNLVTGGTTAASVASLNVNGGGITNAGTISGVTAATTADQAVNFGQLQAVFTQLVQSGLCRIQGSSVSCGVTYASNAVAVGGSSVGDGADNAIAVGMGASAQSAGGIAMGFNATAVQSNSVAIGAGARANSSVALGTGAQATGTNTTAVGDNANASGQFAVAVGNNAAATHDNSVAIGNGSQTSAANTVSVGAAGAERRITSVAAGTAATDAVNLAQLNTAISGLSPQISGARDYTDQQITLTNARTDDLVRSAREYAARGIAASSALPTAMPSQIGKTAFNVGAGHYDGETAVGVSIAHAFSGNLLLSGSIARVSGGDSVSRVGIGFEF